MEHVNYLDGHVYHMTHFRNLCNIFQQQTIFSQETLDKKGIVPHSIAYKSVQDLRNRIFVWDIVEQRYRSFHRYVPFYFARRPPMLYVRASMQNQLVFFVVKRNILCEPGVLFTDGNATNQQLSQNGGECVGIVPATGNDVCHRIYCPNGPGGTNESTSGFYRNIDLLDNLNWYGINGGYIESWEEYKRVRSAEVLVPDMLPLWRIEAIAVNTQAMVQAVNALIKKCGLIGRIPLAIINPDLFIP